MRIPRTLPRILEPLRVDGLLAALRTYRDLAMAEATVLGGAVAPPPAEEPVDDAYEWLHWTETPNILGDFSGSIMTTFGRLLRVGR